MQNWCSAEFKRAKLGDKRLSRRAIVTAEMLAARPSANLPASLGTWTALRAAYRFFRNGNVCAEQIRMSHAAAAVRRARCHSTVLAIQDTSELDFTSHKHMRGLGPIGTSRPQLSAQQGLEMHSTLLASSTGAPLGIAGQFLWARDPAQLGKGKQSRKRPIEDKESYYWLLGVHEAEARVPKRHRLIHIGDIGADVYELFAQARRLNSHLLVRLQHDRLLEEPLDPETGKPLHVIAAVERAPICGQVEVQVRHPQEGSVRTARLSVRFARVTLAPPVRLQSRFRHAHVQVTVVLTQEQDAPTGVSPLRWLLLTTLPIRGCSGAQQCVRWYAIRWLIERYHFVLKSGLGIERLQLDTAEQFERALALCSVVAWRLLALTHEARLHPDAPASAVLQTHEWQALYCVTWQTPLAPTNPPTVGDAVLWIAKLGGFLARKSDGPPGVKTLWRGLSRLADIADTWQFAQKCRTYG